MITRLPFRALSASATPKSLPRASQRCRNLPKRSCSCLRQPVLFQHQSSHHFSTPSIPPRPEAARPHDFRSQLPPSASAPPTSSQLHPKRSLRRYIYATFFLLLGLTAGQYVRMVIAPPPLPLAGSKEDKLMVEFLSKEAEKLPIVQSLSTDPSWKSHDAYSGSAPEVRAHRLTTGPLGGARALGGFQRVFVNEESGEQVTVIWFGGAIAGWPGVAHGGVIATIMDESLGRCAIRQFPSKTGVTANLELRYLKPIVTNSFYVIRVIPERVGSTEYKGWASGRIETIEGRVCVEAKGLFVVPKKFKTVPISEEF